MYEEKIDKKHFVNTYAQDTQMTTLLVVVNKKKREIFEESYLGLLINFNESDFENWQRKTKTNILHQNQNIEDEEQRQAIIDEEFAHVKK